MTSEAVPPAQIGNDPALHGGPDLLGDCSSRRSLLRALGAIGVTTIGAGVLVACGATDGPATGAASSPSGAGSSGTGSSGTGSSGTGSSGTGSSGTDATRAADAGAGGTDGAGPAEAGVPLADVPVGEAVVVDVLGTRYVIAQPTAGEVVAFSAACTHAGTIVAPSGGLGLVCPNHGSRFDATDGSVTKGPAVKPLPEFGATIQGDTIIITV